jgi:hypothetical protein
MKSPTKEHAKKYNKKYALSASRHDQYLTNFIFRDLPVVPVVLDPIVARHLRPHQKEGTFIAFLRRVVNS